MAAKQDEIPILNMEQLRAHPDALVSGDMYSHNGPVCPYCGWQHTGHAHYYEGEPSEWACAHCRREFGVKVTTLTAWTCARRA